MDFTLIIFLLIFLIGIIIAYLVGKRNGIFQRDRYWEEQMPNQRKEAVMQSRAILGGQFSEQLAPYLPNFNYSPTECRFIGKPVDFICFKGMDNKEIDEVVFVEVKSGDSKISTQEKNLRDAIEKKKVRWEEYRVPKEITRKKDIKE
jgi:predicted Holliday junction resolvase-like endonuclease